MKEFLEKISKFNKPPVHEALLITASQICHIPNTLEDMKFKGLMRDDDKLGITATDKAKELLYQSLNRPMNDTLKTEQDIRHLAIEMRGYFPDGKKNGTSLFWKGNKKVVEDRLKRFFYTFGDEWSIEDILSATSRYVASFNGDYRFMRVLPYFIIKQVDTEDGRETKSDLLDYLENVDDKPSVGGYFHENDMIL